VFCALRLTFHAVQQVADPFSRNSQLRREKEELRLKRAQEGIWTREARIARWEHVFATRVQVPLPLPPVLTGHASSLLPY
jgi:hypothetical protein